MISLKLSLLIFSFISITGYCEMPSKSSQDSSCEQFRKRSFPLSRFIRRGHKEKRRTQALPLTPCSISFSRVTSKTFCSYSPSPSTYTSDPSSLEKTIATVSLEQVKEIKTLGASCFFVCFIQALTNQIPAAIFHEKRLVLSLLSLADDEWMQYRNFPPPEFRQPIQGDRPHLLNWPPLPFSQQNKGDFMNHPMPQQNPGPSVYHQYHQ